MVARAKAVSWFNLVASLLMGATAQPLVFEAVAHAGTGELVVAQVSSRATQAHTALSKAIESYRQGDYEIADAFFKEVLPRHTDLTPTEQEEFKRFWQDNVNALAARETANRQLHEAEKALLLGQNTEAATLAKKVSVNEQYMTAADKLKLADLNRQLKLPTEPSTPETKLASPEIAPLTKLNDKKVADPALAPVKVQQGRVQFSQLDFEACEKSLVEADALKATFASSEDSPAKVRADVAKAKADPKILLAAARAAILRKDYDHAEQYAHLAEKIGTSWSLSPWADTPAKVLKDVQAARTQAASCPIPDREVGHEVGREACRRRESRTRRARLHEEPVCQQSWTRTTDPEADHSGQDSHDQRLAGPVRQDGTGAQTH